MAHVIQCGTSTDIYFHAVQMQTGGQPPRAEAAPGNQPTPMMLELCSGDVLGISVWVCLPDGQLF